MKRFLGLIFVVLLSGCAAEPLVLHFEETGERFIGTVYEEAEIVSQKNGAVCIGKIVMTSQPLHPLILSCAGLGGKIDFTCDDGRKAVSNFVTSDCSTGHGTGVDSNGDEFNFYFGPDAMDILKKSTQ